MSTLGWRKGSCANGHADPPRTSSGACRLCVRDYNARTRARYRVLSFRDMYALINALRHFVYGLDDLPWEARSE